MACAVVLKDEKFERVCSIDWDSPPNYDVYFDVDLNNPLVLGEICKRKNLLEMDTFTWIDVNFLL